MKSELSHYLKSFHFKSTFSGLLLIDYITVFIISLFLFLFNKLLEWRIYAVTGGRGIEEFKAMIISGSVDASQAFLSNVKIFTYLFFIGLVISIIFIICLAAISQYLVFSIIKKEKIEFTKKTISRWSGLFLVFLLFALGYSLIYVPLRFVVNLFLPANQTGAMIILGIYHTLYLVVFLVWSLIVLSQYSEKKKVWESIGGSFLWIKTNQKKFWGIIFFASATFLLLNILLNYLIPLRFTLISSAITIFFLKLAIFLLFYNWLRWYVTKVVEKK